MSEHFFLVGRGELTDERAEAVDAIAEERGACFTNPTLPGDGPRYWFACPNRGEPFDSAIERSVIGELRAAGHLNEDGHLITAREEES